MTLWGMYWASGQGGLAVRGDQLPLELADTAQGCVDEGFVEGKHVVAKLKWPDLWPPFKR